MPQRYRATVRSESPNGAICWAPGGPMDCIGPFAKVQNCPVIVGDKEVARLTCYATGPADTWFSVPACTQYKRKHVVGYFTSDEGAVTFRVMNSHKHLFEEKQ